MNKIVYVIITAVALLAFGVGYEFYKTYQPKATVFQGMIEAQSYGVSSKVPGRIDKVFVKKGDFVKSGTLVFTIISPELDAKLAQAKAAQSAAEAKKEEADNGARKEQIKAAEDRYRKAKAAEALMKTTYERIERLYEEGVVSQQKRDEVQTKYKAAKYTASAAKEMAEMAKKGTRPELKKAAAAQEDVYKAKVREVEAYLDETKVYAFHDGEVSQVLIHGGELAPTGFPVVMLIDRSDAWARFAIREDFLKHFEKGKVFDVKIPALGEGSYRFRVSHIAAMGEYAVWKATQSGKGYDMKSFEVELRPIDKIGGLRAGMSVLLSL